VSTLKPCPFCGSNATFERTGTGGHSCIVCCTSCGARHESSDEYERSGESWNARASQVAAPPALPDEPLIDGYPLWSGIPQPAEQTELSDETIAELYQCTFNGMQGGARSAPPPAPLVFVFARAVLAAAKGRQS
jgi:Lar family restriction alleviation protein